MTTNDLAVSDTEPEEAGKGGEGGVLIEAHSKLYASNPAPTQTQKQAPVTLTGCRCRCTACSLYFNSDYAFCKHRVGLHMPMDRRCLTAPEMLEKGMALVGHFWVSKRREAQTIPVNAISSKTGGHSSLVMAEAVPFAMGRAYNRRNTFMARVV